MQPTSIAFVGTVGVPNVYGGFEAFLEATVPMLVKRGHRVTVTCDASRYIDRTPEWNGAARVFIRVGANGASSVMHDAMAFLSVFVGHRNIVMLGVSAGVFFPVFRLLCSVVGKNLIVNVDGVEWRRSKFNAAMRIFLRISDAFAQVCAHRVVIDNEGLRPYLTAAGKRKAKYIPYSGDHVIRLTQESTLAEPTLLSICRIEPENNCEILLKAFSDLGEGRYIFVGNWTASEYGRNLRARFSETPGLTMCDPVYDVTKLARLREACIGYIHGHSVGGTNPSLVEMLFYDAPIAAFDCVFNRNTAGGDAEYFANGSELTALMRRYIGSTHRALKKNRLQYTCSAVVTEYESVFDY
jgi:glycosyltransferase involved in cell wall biosynthesis